MRGLFSDEFKILLSDKNQKTSEIYPRNTQFHSVFNAKEFYATPTVLKVRWTRQKQPSASADSVSS